jgi:hypothetical protein
MSHTEYSHTEEFTAIGYPYISAKLFHRRDTNLMSSSFLLVRLSNHCNDLISGLDQLI